MTDYVNLEDLIDTEVDDSVVTLYNKYEQAYIEYCEEYDSYYNSVKDEWIEEQCGDPTCMFCVGRPEKPSMVK